MSFSILFALLSVLLLVILFVAIFSWKGLKTAIIVTGLSAVLMAGILLAAIGGIVRSMPN